MSPMYAPSLHRRYPEIVASDTFSIWTDDHSFHRWHETAPDDNDNVNVIVQSAGGLSVYAAQLARSSNGDNISHELNRQAMFSSEEVFAPLNSIASRISNLGISALVAIRPSVDFSVERATLSWELEYTVKTSSGIVLQTHHSGSGQSADVAMPEPNTAVARPKLANDCLASNECHDLARWRETARRFAKGAVSVEQKARKVFYATRRHMRYDGTIRHIEEFTHSDVLTIEKHKWGGVCDEWAVVQITLLRALGIAATLKLITGLFPDNGTLTPSTHACVEWRQGSRWCHMDALWKAFDDRTIYRAQGVTNIKVMDASAPLDRRSSKDAWGVKDVTGDQKFHPYEDFVIAPRYPGRARPGYSY